MIVGPEVWDILDRAPVETPDNPRRPSVLSPDPRWSYGRLLETITILNQIFAKAKMETA